MRKSLILPHIANWIGVKVYILHPYRKRKIAKVTAHP